MVRSCEGAMILTSLPSLNGACSAIKCSLISFSVKIAERKSRCLPLSATKTKVFPYRAVVFMSSNS